VKGSSELNTSFLFKYIRILLDLNGVFNIKWYVSRDERALAQTTRIGAKDRLRATVLLWSQCTS